MKPVEELNLFTIKAVIADMLEKGLVTSEYYKTIFYKFIALDESPQSEEEDELWNEVEEIFYKYTAKKYDKPYRLNAFKSNFEIRRKQ